MTNKLQFTEALDALDQRDQFGIEQSKTWHGRFNLFARYEPEIREALKQAAAQEDGVQLKLDLKVEPS